MFSTNTALASDASWSLGVLIGGPVAILLILLGLAALAFGISRMLRDGEGPGFALGAGAWIVFVVIWCLMPMVGFYPYSAEYHQWQPTEGTVSSVSKRLIGSGDGMEEKFVVRFEGDGQQYGCDDTRCASVEDGDHLSLTCKRAWQYAGTDGYDCRFVNTEAAS